jgi:hypothetical protein
MGTSQHLIFESKAFAPVDGEDEETNPGIYGKALVDWLATQLPHLGYPVERLVAEDFGRLIQVASPDCRLYVAVSSTDDTATEWRVFCFTEGGLLRRLFGKATASADARDKLLDALQRIIQSNPSVIGCRKEGP